MNHSHLARGLGALVVAGALFVTSAADAALVFIKATGIPGESTSSGHAQEVEALSVEFGAKSSTSVGSASGGAGAGRASLTELIFSKPADRSSPIWFQDLAQGKVVQQVVVTMVRPGSINPYLTVTLTNAVVSSYHINHDGNGQVVETIGLTYQRINIEYHGTGGNTSASWDVARNAP